MYGKRFKLPKLYRGDYFSFGAAFASIKHIVGQKNFLYQFDLANNSVTCARKFANLDSEAISVVCQVSLV